MLKSKLHNAAITGAEPEYEGSLKIDRDLMDAVKIRPYEKILVANLANGNRFETYAIPAEAGSGTISLNGAMCFLGSVGDRVIVFAFCSVPENEVAAHRPLILVLDGKNKPVGPLKDI
jgi:aspartate 1-decarboxylase